MSTQASFIFDDGFKQSCLRIVDLFEARGLRATFAVMADPSGFLDEFPKGDFVMWNEFQARGHGIHPHGLDHSDLSAIPFEQATAKIDECFSRFGDQLEGFDPSATPYHLTYNRSTADVDRYLLERVRAIRTCGDGEPTDGLSHEGDLSRRTFGCTWHGPDYCDDHLLASLQHAEGSASPLFLYMMHGLDGEGWGPIRESGLQKALDFVEQSDTLTYRPIDNLTGGLKP